MYVVLRVCLCWSIYAVAIMLTIVAVAAAAVTVNMYKRMNERDIWRERKE